MKTNKIISGVMAITALCAVKATAQINYQAGDLLAGFRNGGGAEIIVDLGNISLYQQSGGSSFSINGVSAALLGQFGSVSGVSWSVFGANDSFASSLVSQADSFTIWTTKMRANPSIQNGVQGVLSSGAQQLVVNDIGTVGFLTTTNADPGITDISLNIVSVPTSANGYTTYMASPANGDFSGDWKYNIENTGPGVSDLFQDDPGGVTQHASYLGNFSLDSSGNFTFTPVPEPSTWALLGLGLMTLLAVRRRSSHKPSIT